MKLIEKYIQNQLQGDADLLDPALIDHSLTDSENKTELMPCIRALQSTEVRCNNMIKRVTLKAIKQQNQAYERQSHRLMMHGFWECIRRKYKRLKRKTNSPTVSLQDGVPSKA